MQTSSIAVNLERVRSRIARACERAGRSHDEITIVAVSKTFPPDLIRAAHDAGLRHFGENRVQEFETKHAYVKGFVDSIWHFVGHLQSNKVHRAVHLFDRIDSVDSIHLAEKLDSAALAADKRMPLLIEVRLSRESTKTGVAVEELPALVAAVKRWPCLELRGLMTIPPYFDDPEDARPYFRKLRELRDDVCQRLGVSLPVLSMGMSHDFEVAIEEGATDIRVGTALFGERSKR
ncbi:MAG TPA: YggS family pyridoxal phosphate-dependent enzyme [Candidatus Acidoferrales bacterium]|nr:YggS family pyridoxal phosphate-dependent enzyme [Candidatus Acidoferrales bacterium]